MSRTRRILGVTVLILLLAVRAASALVPAHPSPGASTPASVLAAKP